MSTTPTANPWIMRPQKRSGARLRLFCFPYAGGTAATYRSWPDALPGDVDLCAVQLPGRGGRFREPPFRRLADLVRAAAPALRPHLDIPYALFGHSMGALVVFELARELRRLGAPAPVCLIVSGHEAPHRPDPDPPVCHLSDAEFLAEISRRYNAIPSEILEQPELLQLLLPVIRADFATIETYAYAPEDPFTFPITCLGGLDDVRVSREDLEAWREHTRGPFRLKTFPGGHFFLDSARADVLRAVAADVTEPSSRTGTPWA